jgi:hypothetical protein
MKPSALSIAGLASMAIAGLSMGACALDAQSARADGMFVRTLPVTGTVDLDVRSGSGTIQVRTGGSEVVEVTGRVRCWDVWSGASAEECVRRIQADPPITQSGNVIRLDGRSDWWSSDNVSIAYEVVVPADSRVRTRSGSGNQFVGAVLGDVDARAGSADIRIEGVGGNVRASTGSGRIDIQGSRGSVVVHSGSGGINAMSVGGDLEVHTGSGRVSIANSAEGRTAVTTGSGDISVTQPKGSLRLRAASGDVVVGGDPVDEWRVTTASGSVTLSMPPDAKFDLDAHSNSGRLDSEHPITVLGGFSRRQLHGKVRGGGPQVDVSTASGSIRIR